MGYFYLHLFKPQFFFPKGFMKHEMFLSFYHPYSRIGIISWRLFRFVPLYRCFFFKNNIESYIPEKAIRAITSKTAKMAFNTGTVGPEQKITALGVENNSCFFIKYAQTPLASVNVTNEYNTLIQLDTFDYVPRVLDFQTDNNSVMLKTSVLKGIRFGGNKITTNLLELLFTLAELRVNTSNTFKTDLRTAFAHGDFCPWNIMKNDNRVFLFDWEMAATYPLGFDLFTFIFQTNFLLYPETDVEKILKENSQVIDKYFRRFDITEWVEYLLVFAEIKLAMEQQKVTRSLFSRYQTLVSYGQKA